MQHVAKALGYPHAMVTERLLRAPADLAGTVLAAATRALGVLRNDPRPLHPRGEWWTARLRRTGTQRPTGAQWVDASGEDDVLVRFSTSVGLPGWCPDIQGVAMRVSGGDDTSYADVLWASTGTSSLGRYVLRPARAGRGSPYTTLLPYRGPRGSLLLRLEERGEGTYELAHAGVRGPWHPFAVLTLQERVPSQGDGDAVRFDPVLSPPPGLRFPDWVVRVREPAYVAARR